jgi:hypothetical protein
MSIRVHQDAEALDQGRLFLSFHLGPTDDALVGENILHQTVPVHRHP